MPIQCVKVVRTDMRLDTVLKRSEHVLNRHGVTRGRQRTLQVYAPQTKILEGRTKRPEHLFDALFNDS